MSLDFSLKCSCCNSCVFDKNITHNLTKMASKAGIYNELWHPEDINCIYGKDIIIGLREGLKKLKENPNYYKQFNAENSWGLYENFVEFVEDVYNACKQYPKCLIEVSR